MIKKVQLKYIIKKIILPIYYVLNLPKNILLDLNLIHNIKAPCRGAFFIYNVDSAIIKLLIFQIVTLLFWLCC